MFIPHPPGATMKPWPLVGTVVLISGLLTGCSGGGNASMPTPSFTIASFTSSNAQVTQGQSATLSWTLSGTPTGLTLDGVALPLTQTSAPVTPSRRQTYTLVATSTAG